MHYVTRVLGRGGGFVLHPIKDQVSTPTKAGYEALVMGESAVEQIWHMQASQGKILALA